MAASFTCAQPQNDADSRIAKTLAVQKAMARARGLLTEQNSAKAVEVLEEQLPKVNGNAEYLILLREAYRAHIRDLHLANQPEQTRRYLERLCIIDSTAEKDASLRTPTAPAPRKFEFDQARLSKIPFPMFKMPSLTNPFARQEEPAPAAKPSVIRAQAEDLISVDPFDAKNRREMALEKPSSLFAQDWLARGAVEFKNERYTDAQRCFAQAYRADQAALDTCRAQWAYCIIKGVCDAIEQPGILPAQGASLKQQVESAISLAPDNLTAVGQALIQQIDRRSVAPESLKVRPGILNVKHWGRNKEGWEVAQTDHFIIFHRKDKATAERIAQIAEDTRQAVFRKWFESEGEKWDPPCELIVHANGADYSSMTGVSTNVPGHTRILPDPSGRVASRRMDMRLDIPTMLDTVLPHETTHVVLAGMFGNHAVPRWADEGIAILSEPGEKVEQHRKNLFVNQKDGLLFGLKELMELREYPHPRRIGAFYAQSVVLVEFLTQRRGPKVLTEFINDSLRHGHEAALQRHYHLSFAQLEQAWAQQVFNSSSRNAAAR